MTRPASSSPTSTTIRLGSRTEDLVGSRTSTATGTVRSTSATRIEVATPTAGTTTSPTGCIGDTLVTDGRCYDGLRNFSQVRPAVFDGGYAFGVPFTDLPLTSGPYVVEAVPPPGYKIQDEASKNVDFGDTFRSACTAPRLRGRS